MRKIDNIFPTMNISAYNMFKLTASSYHLIYHLIFRALTISSKLLHGKVTVLFPAKTYTSQNTISW